MSDSAQGKKPPSKINGKINPAWTRWYRAADPARYERTRNKWQEKRKKKLHRSGAVVPFDHVKCYGCGLVYLRSMARDHGFRFFEGRPHLCVCSECLEKASALKD